MYVWLNGTLGPVRELVLPHSPRMVLFPQATSASIAHLAISPTEFLILRIPIRPSRSLSFAEGPPIALPGVQDAAAAGSAAKVPGMGALSGLGGYVGKGLGAFGSKSGPVLMGTAVGDGELLVMREGEPLLQP